MGVAMIHPRRQSERRRRRTGCSVRVRLCHEGSIITGQLRSTLGATCAGAPGGEHQDEEGGRRKRADPHIYSTRHFTNTHPPHPPFLALTTTQPWSVPQQQSSPKQHRVMATAPSTHQPLSQDPNADNLPAENEYSHGLSQPHVDSFDFLIQEGLTHAVENMEPREVRVVAAAAAAAAGGGGGGCGYARVLWPRASAPSRSKHWKGKGWGRKGG